MDVLGAIGGLTFGDATGGGEEGGEAVSVVGLYGGKGRSEVRQYHCGRGIAYGEEAAVEEEASCWAEP